jgi:hypothetical protein
MVVESRRLIEVYSAGCPVCDELVEQVTEAACPSCEVSVLDMRDPDVVRRGIQLGVKSIPAVSIDGQLASCCTPAGPDLDVLRDAGLGRASRSE